MGEGLMRVFVAAGFLVGLAVGLGMAQEGPRPSYQTMTPEQRSERTREFLGLGAKPDREAAGRGAPLFGQNCAFCHGPQARGATGPNLITSDVVLGDDHGEHLVPWLKKGRPEKGMPAFASVPDQELKDIAEFLHLQVEEVANRGAYHVLNILVGDEAKGKAYVRAHCMSCHSEETFAHIGSRFRSPEQLQRGWIWPSRAGNAKLAVRATVKMPNGTSVAGRVVQISDFRITVEDAQGVKHAVERDAGVAVDVHDPLAAHEPIVTTLRNDVMHNVTAYLESLK
jgi:cytochrome c oxidase cbb3-type subunit III